MKRSIFTETQIVKAIQEQESGRDAKDICRELGHYHCGILQMAAALWRTAGAITEKAKGTGGRELSP